MQKTSSEGLIRGIRRWDLVAVTINGIIGAGIFGLPGKIYSLTGTYSIIALAVCALVVTLIILCFAEVGSRFDKTGGQYLYARHAFGPLAAFEVGWLEWLARVTAFAANSNLLVSYLSYFWPAATSSFWRAVVITLVVLVLTAINIRGVRQTAIVSDVFTIGKLAPILVFVMAGAFFLNPHAYSLGARPSLGVFSQTVLLLVYAFTGFEMATVPAGEVRDPRRHLPRALLMAIALVVVVYILIQVVCIGTLPELANSQKPLADAGSRFLGAAGGAIISVGAIVSISGNLNIVLLSGSRVVFAIAEHQQLPAFVARTNRRFFTPHVAIIITASLMLGLALKSSFVAALTVSTIVRLITYGATCAALPVLRRRRSAPPALLHLPGGPFIAIAALSLAVWLLAHSTWREARNAAIAGLAGLLIYGVYSFSRKFLCG
jgi:amino acid transporter